MDQASIVPTTIVQKFSALSIEGSEDAQSNFKSPLYRQPGYSTKTLELMQLMSKPLGLPPITIDSTFAEYTYMISSIEVTLHQWVEKFLQNFISPRFNLRLTLILPGNQFAVLQLGGAYIPSLLDEQTVYCVGSEAIFNAPLSTHSVALKHNQIVSLGGAFIELSSSPSSMVLTSNIPINYPTNPLDSNTIARNVFFGGFRIIPIVPIRFGDSITSVTARPYLNLCDLEFTPWK